MKVFVVIVGVLLCSSSSLLAHSTSKTDYSCYYFNDDGEETNRGYEVSLWFDASVTTRFLPKNDNLRTLGCEIDPMDSYPHEVTVECKSIDLTLTINKKTGRALATIKGDAREMICHQQS